MSRKTFSMTILFYILLTIILCSTNKSINKWRKVK